MIEEARLEPVASGLAPVTPGWFVVNAREAAWMNNDQTESCCIFESDDFVLRGRPDLTEYEKPGAGFVLRVLRPGRPTGFYHAESVQEDFLVLGGRCRVILNSEERQLGQWDFLHCPAGTEHVFVGAEDGPCWILMVGARGPEVRSHYPANETAARYGASAPESTDDSKAAYADWPNEPEPARLPWPPA